MKTGFSGGVANKFLNSKLTPLLIGASLIAGLGGLLTTPREEEPQIQVPMIDVAVGLPGGSPEEVERRVVEPLITLAKVDDVANRRLAFDRLRDKEAVGKLFSDLGPRFKERPGGYLRILKMGPRPGDAAPMALVQLVDGPVEAEAAAEK